MQRPFHAIGLLFRREENRLADFLGSCFSFRHATFFLTARHCVGTLESGDLAVAAPSFSGSEGLSVKEIWKHPTADIAILRTSELAKDHLQPFTHVDRITEWGEPIAALGFPEESRADQSIRPTIRYFRGFVQRIFDYREQTWDYPALELSFGAPAGLSGGPIFPTRDIGSVIGVASANHLATTYLASVAKVQDGSNSFTEHIHNQIEYGICVRLDAVAEWIDSIIPR